MAPLHAIYWLWVVWYASWLASLFWTKRASARADFRLHAPYQYATLAGIVLLFVLPSWSLHQPVLWALGDNQLWVCFALVFAAFAFAWWARLVMGRLWSGLISRTADHHVIDTGPFGLVRHPIYTAIIFAAFVTGAAEGTAAALAGAAMFALAFWWKARLEEYFLCSELGPAAYNAYRRRAGAFFAGISPVSPPIKYSVPEISPRLRALAAPRALLPPSFFVLNSAVVKSRSIPA